MGLTAILTETFSRDFNSAIVREQAKDISYFSDRERRLRFSAASITSARTLMERAGFSRWSQVKTTELTDGSNPQGFRS